MLARWALAACLCGAPAPAWAAAPHETPVHAELMEIVAQYQQDRPAAIRRLQALQDHMPAGATFDDRSKTLNTLINFYLDSGDARARRYVDELAALGERQQDLESTLWAQNYRGRVLTLLDAKPAEGARVIEAALERAAGVSHRLAGALHDSAAMCYEEQSDFKSALRHQQAALALLDGHGERDQFHRAVALNNISALYNQMGDPRQALDYNRQAQTVAESQHAQAMLAELAFGRCDLYGKLKQPEQAATACQQSLAMARRVGDRRLEASVLSLLGNRAWQQGRYPECLRYAEAALALRQDSPADAASARTDLGLCHIGTGAVQQGEGEIRAALALYRAGNDDQALLETLDALVTAYERNGLYREAFGALRELTSRQEEVAQRNLDRATLKMRSELEFTARQKEIAALQEKNQLQAAELTNEKLELAVGVLVALLVAVVGFFKLREKERSRRQAQLENHKKSRFVAEAAHDLRQPMQAIGNLLGAAAHAIGRGDIGKSSELIDTAQKATNVMRSSFNAVLELSRLECGAITAEYSSFDLAELVSETVFALRPLSEARSVSIRLRLRAGRPLIVRSDRQLLGRVLSNLLTNAIKYSEPARPGGAAVVVGVVALGCHCRVDIVDNGVGIAPELQQKIFKPFFQADNPGRDRERGIGLGLTIVDSILGLLERHTLSLRSTPGAGSRFLVRVPVAGEHEPVTPALAAAPATSPDDVAGLYLLYVEDDRLVRRSTEALLREYRVLCEAAASLAELEALLPGLERMPDLVLTDYTLPAGRTARDVVRAVREEFDASLPVIVLTGESEALTLDGELEGATILRKPVDAATLLARIRALCG
ncbi:signal transduction histidine kinase/CheY-like chemotaxis protein [Duganella sp. SG902]|uniref:ATP-binding protein n=1 Tax=Duganella sp. SG902 TaxID=2587016 RepID=UPI00159E614E|nr:ATP-binding protein [Duganella sp. SG902]NVM77648.1 signal transduction histidine kinase/CheY-like chemotaxis protein [Duganella sp. SG902]